MSGATVGNRILWLAVLGSVALHALLLLWPRAPTPLPSAVRPTLVMVEVEPPRAQAPPQPRPPPPPAQPAPAARPEPAARPPPPASAQAATPEPPPRRDMPTADSPRAATLQLNPAMLPGGAFTLAFDAGLPEPVVRRGLDPPKDLVGSLARETLGRGRVERGLVHPYYSTLGKALIKRWDVDRVAKAGGLKAYGEQLGQNLKIFNGIWADRAEAYGKSGSPLDPSVGTRDGYRRPPPDGRITGDMSADLESRKELAREMQAQFKATRRATIRVVQDRTGKLVRVELVDPSNDANVDREALKDVQAAAEQLPVPPEEAVGGRQELSSLWSFELIVSISPPVPTFTFEFDEAMGFIDARLPLDRRVYKKVRLVAVE
jgi:hypothetical protein